MRMILTVITVLLLCTGAEAQNQQMVIGQHEWFGIDLNGDGRADHVKLTCYASPFKNMSRYITIHDRFVLDINGVTATGGGDGLHGDFEIWDIDESDQYLD